MGDTISRISAQDVKARIKDGGEFAILDAREELTFGKRHLLLASCVPLSRLEVRVGDLVPRRTVRVSAAPDWQRRDAALIASDGEGRD